MGLKDLFESAEQKQRRLKMKVKSALTQIKIGQNKIRKELFKVEKNSVNAKKSGNEDLFIRNRNLWLKYRKQLDTMERLDIKLATDIATIDQATTFKTFNEAMKSVVEIINESISAEEISKVIEEEKQAIKDVEETDEIIRESLDEGIDELEIASESEEGLIKEFNMKVTDKAVDEEDEALDVIDEKLKSALNRLEKIEKTKE